MMIVLLVVMLTRNTSIASILVIKVSMLSTLMLILSVVTLLVMMVSVLFMWANRHLYGDRDGMRGRGGEDNDHGDGDRVRKW